MLNELTGAGYRIGNVAALSAEELRKLWQAHQVTPVQNGSERENANAGALPKRRTGTKKPMAAAKQILDRCLSSVQQFDAPALEQQFEAASVQLGFQGTLQLVIAPLAQQIGVLWREGTLTSAHEHFATSVVRLFLAHAARGFATSEISPVLIVATPTGQLHELGALLVGASATNLGWRVIYLGASLAAAEIAGAALQNSARAVALSLVYPEDDPALEQELLLLRHYLPPESAIIIGGRALEAFQKTVDKVTSLQAHSLSDLNLILDGLRKPIQK